MDASPADNRFALSEDAPQCDLVLKGGVTSGVVYPQAILELATQYRFRSVGGASVGAIAAAFAAAAEYARRRGDLQGYARLEAHCRELPRILRSLFQPEPSLAPVFAAFLALMKPRPPSDPDAPDGRRRTPAVAKLGAALWALRGWVGAGAALGALAYPAGLALVPLVSDADPWTWAAVPGLVFAALLGMATYPVARLWLLADRFHDHLFGFCSGHGEGKAQALTDWVHEALQDIAFADPKHPVPLTFGDLAGEGPLGIDLRLMTTNLSLQRPEVIPRSRLKLLFEPPVWRGLFPPAVMDYLEGRTGGGPAPRAVTGAPQLRALPRGDRLPVLVGVRMSLCYPVLFQAIPLHIKDSGARARGEVPPGQPTPIERIWFTDGGITSNFPIHFFDSLLPARPTFAISLDESRKTQTPEPSMPQEPAVGALRPIDRVQGLAGFAMALFGTARSWQDEVQSVLPGLRQRIVRIYLPKGQGGLNLDMDEATVEDLMALGGKAGRLVRTAYNSEEHRWRRTILAYEQLEALAGHLRQLWPQYEDWYDGYIDDVQSYRHITPEQRSEIGDRLSRLAAAAEAMEPPLRVRFPQPRARLRSMPDL